MNVKHVCIFLLLCLLTGCRTTRVADKTTEETNEQSAAADTVGTKRTYSHEGERQSHSFYDEWENLEFKQVVERDSSGTEKTTTTVNVNRNRRHGETASEKESTAQQADSTAISQERKARNRYALHEMTEEKEPPPAVTGIMTWKNCLLAVFLGLGVFFIIWPEPVRMLGRFVIRMIKRILTAWIRR